MLLFATKVCLSIPTLSMSMLLFLSRSGCNAHVHSTPTINGEGTSSSTSCGTKDPTPEETNNLMKAMQNFEQLNNLDDKREEVGGVYKIDTYWHMIMSSHGAEGDVSDVLNASMDRLNNAFTPTLFEFVLVDTFKYYNDTLFDGNFDTVREMNRNVLGSTVLNIYSNNMLGVGKASWPWEYKEAPEIDNVMIGYDTVMDGADPNGKYNGGILVHEVGHWLGLYHPSQFLCENGGDIDDLPHVGNMFGFGTTCENIFDKEDSCPDDGKGPDMIENYMDYTNCYEKFTPGQYERMESNWWLYRANDDNNDDDNDNDSNSSKKSKKRTKKTLKKGKKQKYKQVKD